MITSAVNALLLALLTLLPTAARSVRADEPADSDDSVVVSVGDGDFDFDGNDPVIVRVGRGGFIGVTLVEITPELRAHFGAPKDAGVLVSDVRADTPAAKAGVEVGDVITAVDGKRVRWSGDVSRGIRGRKAGETVALDVVRGGAARKLSVTVEERKGGERSIDLGEMKDTLRKHPWNWRDFGPNATVIDNLDEFPRMSERIEELEKRVKELEKRPPGR